MKFRCSREALLCLAIICVGTVPVAAQPAGESASSATTSAETSPSPPDVSALVHAATGVAKAAAWDAGSGFRQGQRAALSSLPPEAVKSSLAMLTVEHALFDARQTLERKPSVAAIADWKVVLEEEAQQQKEADAKAATATPEQPPTVDPLVEQRERERAAAVALEAARLREANERDAALKALIGRERTIAEETLTWTEGFGKNLEAVLAENGAIEKQWTTFIEPHRTSIEGFTKALSQVQRSETVDPIFLQLIGKRREVWSDITATRQTLEQAREEVDAATERVEKARREWDALTAKGEAKTPLSAQRLKLAKAALDLAEAKLEGARDLEAAQIARLQLKRDIVDELSVMIRGMLPFVSDTARSNFYDLFDAQNWRDARLLLDDKINGGRDHLRGRWEAASSMRERLASVLLWFLALMPRLFLFVLATFALRFVPPLLRRGLDFALERPMFGARPRFAIKLYEMLRASAKPLLYLWVMSYIFAYVGDSFPEVIPFWGAVEAVFLFWVLDRLSRTLFYARSRREESGAAKRGGIDDLTKHEAQMANLFMLEESIANRAVRSTRLFSALLIAWLWALDVLYAVVGYSVLSFLVYWVLVAAVFVLAFWVLSAWRQEIANLFERLAGDRAPGASAFVAKHKDRFYGVAVVAVAAVVLIAWEIGKFMRMYFASTGAFKRWNNFLFATKVELQSRYDEHRAALASMPEDAEAFFLKEFPEEDVPWFDRGLLPKLEAFADDWTERSKMGSVLVVGERGVGRTALLESFVRATENATYRRAPSVSSSKDALAFLAECFELDATKEGSEDGVFEDVDAFIATLLEQEPRTIVIDDLERMFVRTVRGYGAILTLCRVISETDRRHFWVVSSARQAWSFLQRVHDLGHNFAHIFTVPNWSADELKQMLLARCEKAGITISFQALGSAAAAGDVVKTEEGYFRYLEEFTQGNPAAALHYWRQSLCETDVEGVDYAVQLFDRRHAAGLEKLDDRQRFLLNAILQHGDPDLDRISVAINLSHDRVKTFVHVLEDKGVVCVGGESVWLAREWSPLVVRYLADSNLLVSQ